MIDKKLEKNLLERGLAQSNPRKTEDSLIAEPASSVKREDESESEGWYLPLVLCGLLLLGFFILGWLVSYSNN